MSNNKNKNYKFNNEEGKRLYEKTLLQYSKEIINEIKNNPEKLPKLLSDLGMNEKEFYMLLSHQENGNITFYDESLNLLRKK